VRRLTYRYQRTIAGPVVVEGTGFLTGATVRLEFRPAPAQTGIVFVRNDLWPPAYVPARVAHVTGTHRRTTLQCGSAEVSLVEHVLAALAGMRIDNCYVELDAAEPPGLDGSSRQFVDRLLDAGAVLQPAARPICVVDQPVTVTSKGCSLTLHPTDTDELKITYMLDYGLGSPVGRHTHTQIITPERFASALADSRTFLLDTEVEEFRRQGLGQRTSTSDLLVMGRHGPVGNALRHADETARHKVLDIIGDLSLLGLDIRGHVVAYRSGHPLNIELVRTLARQLPMPTRKVERQAA
jgi:UDP-3-O-acyl N-acetylglucosamine deacetylase